ncbi:MAG: response regulator, partial [Acidimicrobiia bacterium]|nr:response regulator [Acidimicrobiia bacterium]
MQDRRILVVDDEPSIRHVLNSLFEMRGCDVRVAASAEEALAVLAEWEPEVALFDIVLPGKNGIALLGEVKQSHPDIEVLMMTSKASAETAVKSLRLGASDYVNKPFDLQEVWATVERAVERRNLTLKNRALQGDQERKRRELSSAVSFEQRDANGGTSPIAEILDEFLRLIVREVDVDRANLMLTAPGGRLELAVTQGVVADSPCE